MVRYFYVGLTGNVSVQIGSTLFHSTKSIEIGDQLIDFEPLRPVVDPA